MIGAFKVIFSSKYIKSVKALTVYNFNHLYQGSFLGIMWSLIQPMVYIAVMSLVFSLIMRFEVNDFVIYLASGTITWSFMVNAVISGSTALLRREGVLKKVILPKTIFPVTDVLMNLMICVLSFICITIFITAFVSPAHLKPSLLLLPIAFIPVFITSLSGAIFFAYATPYFRDITHLLGVIFSVLFWTVPIVYPITLVPISKRAIFDCNPLYILIQPVQHLFYTGEFLHMKRFMTAIIISLICMVVTYFAYLKLHKRVIYYI